MLKKDMSLNGDNTLFKLFFVVAVRVHKELRSKKEIITI